MNDIEKITKKHALIGEIHDDMGNLGNDCFLHVLRSLTWKQSPSCVSCKSVYNKIQELFTLGF